MDKTTNYLLLPWQRYAQFSGRARRLEYGLMTLVNLGIGIAVMIAAALGPTVGGLFGILALIYGLASIIPSIAVSIRRLHDLGQTGWWMLLAFVPVVNIIFGLAMLAVPGQVGPNRFGADPKDASDAAVRG